MSRSRCAAILLLLSALAGGAAAQPHAPMEPVEHAVCRLIEEAAGANHLPVGFMTRVIWRESSFRAGVVSPAGAEGIAQFMPGTARERGVADPFDPEQAIPEAARLLAELRQRFGSLAVAAAAYNAGAARVSGWLRGEIGLPAETRAYVRFVTADGIGAGANDSAISGAGARSCTQLIEGLRRDRGGGEEVDAGFAPLAPWGVQLAGNFSKPLALAAFERARRHLAAIIADQRPMIIGRLLRSRGTRRFYQVRLPAGSRAAAAALCGRIRADGGACMAIRS